VQRYLARVSGPLLDRIDIHLEVPAVKYKALTGESGGEPSEAIRMRVDRPRVVQPRNRTIQQAAAASIARTAAISDARRCLLRRRLRGWDLLPTRAIYRIPYRFTRLAAAFAGQRLYFTAGTSRWMSIRSSSGPETRAR